MPSIIHLVDIAEVRFGLYLKQTTPHRWLAKSSGTKYKNLGTQSSTSQFRQWCSLKEIRIRACLQACRQEQFRGCRLQPLCRDRRSPAAKAVQVVGFGGIAEAMP
jgi:hypothetical protein